MTFIELLNNPAGKRLVAAIEDVQSSLNNYPNGDAELLRIRASMIAELKATFGFDYSV